MTGLLQPNYAANETHSQQEGGDFLLSGKKAVSPSSENANRRKYSLS